MKNGIYEEVLDLEGCLRDEFGTECFIYGKRVFEGRIIRERESQDIYEEGGRGKELNVEAVFYKRDLMPKLEQVMTWKKEGDPVKLKIKTIEGWKSTSPIWTITLSA